MIIPNPDAIQVQPVPYALLSSFGPQDAGVTPSQSGKIEVHRNPQSETCGPHLKTILFKYCKYKIWRCRQKCPTYFLCRIDAAKQIQLGDMFKAIGCEYPAVFFIRKKVEKIMKRPTSKKIRNATQIFWTEFRCVFCPTPNHLGTLTHTRQKRCNEQWPFKAAKDTSKAACPAPQTSPMMTNVLLVQFETLIYMSM